MEEIESEILRVSSINESLPFKQRVVVIARKLEQATSNSFTDDRQLIAFIVTTANYNRTEHQKMANTLHAELSKTLNGYMLPAYYQFLEVLPTTLSGKINRVELFKMMLDPVFHSETSDNKEHEENVVTTISDQGPLHIIKKIFIAILKLPSNKTIQDSDSFFNLGGQSVLALRLQKALKKEFGSPVKLANIFRNPTPAGLVTVIGPQSTKTVASSTTPSNSTDLDWSKETHLPNDKRYWPRGLVKSKQPAHSVTDDTLAKTAANKSILLIGADGFVGYYMIKYLLMLHPDTKVYLLGLEERFNLGDLFAAFTLHKLFDLHLSHFDLLSRTEVIVGTMGQENFGLSEPEFDKLGQTVQSIYHTGGFVSLLATYSDLRARNVQSMFTMIDLASRNLTNEPTSLHYISTWSVIHLQTWKNTTMTKNSVWLDEQNADSFQPPPNNDQGYFKTRWVAEMLMEEAARRGFPTTIYRAPAHTAPIGSLSATPSDNFTINLYLSMAQTGLILRTPERADKIESDIGMMPINYLADTIVRLANTKESRAVTGEALRLHIVNPKSVPYSKAPALVAEVREDHVPGTMMDVEEWFETMVASSNEKAYLEWATYKEYLDNGHLMFTIDDTKTRPLLDEIDAAKDPRREKCAPVDVEYYRSILTQEKMFNAEKR